MHLTELSLNKTKVILLCFCLIRERTYNKLFHTIILKNNKISQEIILEKKTSNVTKTGDVRHL